MPKFLPLASTAEESAAKGSSKAAVADAQSAKLDETV